MLDEADYDRDDAAPIDMLESYFAAHGWEHERQDDEVIAKVKGSWTQYELRALWREEDSVIQFLAFPDIRVADDRRVAIYEAIGLINEQLWVGHFELMVVERDPAVSARGDDRRGGRHDVARRGRIAGGKRDRRMRTLLPGVPVRIVGAARRPRKRSPPR